LTTKPSPKGRKANCTPEGTIREIVGGGGFAIDQVPMSAMMVKLSGPSIR